MQVSLKWINELLDLEVVSLDDLIEKLTLGGFEVEEILEIEIENQIQIALDISATANRSDSLSTQGIVTEIATLLNQQPKISPYSRQLLDWRRTIETATTRLSGKEEYSVFLGIIVQNIETIQVPQWLTQKLVSSGVIPKNDVTDFQNYILLETGYPFAFYDYDAICSRLNGQEFELSVARAKNQESFVSTEEENYLLNDSTLVIQANEVTIGIGGIAEHQDFSPSSKSSSFLVEASIFNAASIRQQSRNLGFRTDRSARYEKSLKNVALIESLYRLIWLLRISNPTLECVLHTAYQFVEEERAPIIFRYGKANEILGPTKESTSTAFKYIQPDVITDYFNRLNFSFSYHPETLVWEVNIPPSRSEDLISEIDLVEEIGRLHGFNNFLTALPTIKTIGIQDFSYQTRSKITSCLLNSGWNELIHYSLVGKKTFVENQIELINPLLSDYSSLRISLLPNLVTTVQENLRQGNSIMEGFEYGHVFLPDEKTKFKEHEYLSGVFGGIATKVSWSASAKSLTWFQAKGKIEQFFQKLDLSPSWKPSSSVVNSPMLHPYRSAQLYFSNNQRLGVFGQIHPKLANHLDLPSDLYLFEFSLEEIQAQMRGAQVATYKEYPNYPKIVKDLSFIVKQEVPFQKLQDTLYLNGTRFLSEIHLLDEYRGSSIPTSYTSLCLQLTFQSKEKTLENKDIEKIIQHLQALLTSQFGAILRD